MNKGKHIITSSIEHQAILHTCQDMEKQGFKITFLPVDEYGLVDVKHIISSITDETIMVSIMHANNEIGTIQPIKEIVKAIRHKSPTVFSHTDAVQTVGKFR